MNIEYAQTIALCAILNKAGIKAAGQPGKETSLYYFQDKETPSLSVDHNTNTWRDTISGIGGGSVELVAELLKQRGEACALVDVLHWLKFKISYPPLIRFLNLPQEQAPDELYRITCRVKLQEGGLIRYAISRGVDIAVAKELFKQLYIENRVSGKEFAALGFKNEDGGYAVYNNHIETHLMPVAVTFVRGGDKPDTVHIFKDVFDWQAAIKSRAGDALSGDCIILNTWRNLDNAAAYIRGYGYRELHTWFDSSSTGDQATVAFRWLCTTEENLIHHAVKPLTATL